MDSGAATQILGWKYEALYDLYNANPSTREHDLVRLVDPASGYFSVRDETLTLVAFRCFGADGQVPGGDYDQPALDTGGGLRPDLTGRGLGLEVLKAGLEFGRAAFHPDTFRVTVAAFNQRALTVCERAGFRPVQQFGRKSDGLEFVVLVLTGSAGTRRSLKALEAAIASAESPAERAQATYALAIFHDNNSREIEAIPHYESALALGLDPATRVKALSWLASSLYKTGKPDEALIQLGAASEGANSDLRAFQAGLRRRIMQSPGRYQPS